MSPYISALKSAGHAKVGALGACWGYKVAMLSGDQGWDAIAAVHPSYVRLFPLSASLHSPYLSPLRAVKSSHWEATCISSVQADISKLRREQRCGQGQRSNLPVTIQERGYGRGTLLILSSARGLEAVTELGR